MRNPLKIGLWICITLALLPRVAGAQEIFQYKHRAGDTYRVISTVFQDVFIDRRLSHSAEILNRIAVEVLAEEGGVGRHRATFQTSERAVTAGAPGVSSIQSFQWAREYDSEFSRDRRGIMDVGARYFMPVVRNVPVFPARALRPGDRWSHEGHEVHDFRDGFGIASPYVIPFVAFYEFLGEREWAGRMLPAFSVTYSIGLTPQPVPGRVFPRRIAGNSDQVVFWDLELGQPVAYTEDFRYLFELSDGRTIEYRGWAQAEIVESLRMDREGIAREIAEDIARLGIEDVFVRVSDEGIIITLEDVQFQPDTTIMLEGEMEKLQRIAEILARYPERDILVGGHTALAGTAEGRMSLSIQRAAVVADYLIDLGARAPERVVVRGYGAERPVADNATEEGMRRNRRVEITILEN
ncbi:MAG: OmpA family protein [Treponema sp.]|nr:OmpA family protein [Treponema sp.]